MRYFTAYAPHVLIGVTIATFVLVGAMQFSYYTKAFEKSAVTLDWVFGLTIALVTQAARFALVTNGANHFAHDRKGKGTFSVVFSAALTAMCSYEMSHLADVWASQNPEYGAAIPIIVQVIIWLGFGLELMLLSALAGSAVESPDRNDAQDYQKDAPLDLKVFQDGNGITA